MICIPVMGNSRSAVLKAIEKSARQAEMIELRMDLIPQGDLKEFIEKSRAVSPSLKILVTNRSTGQSGRHGVIAAKPISDEEKKRIKILKEAVALGCDYVDCELETTESLRNDLLSMIELNNRRTKLIISDHHFQKTPSLNSLKRLYNDCIKAQADIAKIVAFATRPEDNLRMLELVVHARKEGRNIAAFCMGRLGTISRIAAPLLGSCITYVSLNRGGESAPGQLTVRDIKEIFRRLEKTP